MSKQWLLRPRQLYQISSFPVPRKYLIRVRQLIDIAFQENPPVIKVDRDPRAVDGQPPDVYAVGPRGHPM